MERKWVWRILTVIFGVATLVSLGLAIWSIKKNEELTRRQEETTKRETALNLRMEKNAERLQDAVDAYEALQQQLVSKVELTRALGEHNVQLNKESFDLLQRHHSSFPLSSHNGTATVPVNGVSTYSS